MRQRFFPLWVGLATILVGQMSGCADFFLVAVRVPLEGADGVFNVAAGGTAENTVPITEFDREFTVGSGSFGINDSAITVIPDGGSNDGQGAGALQADVELRVTLHVDDLEDLDAACDSDDSYGPYVMTLPEDFSPRAASPSRVSFSANTLRLFVVGEWSLCVQVDSSATVPLEVQMRDVTARLGF